MDAGEEFGIGLFGSRALNALRLEKNYGSWAREYRPIYGPLEAGLDRFVAYGRTRISSARPARSPSASEGGKLRLRAFIVEADDADVIGDEPIWFGGAGARLGHVGRLCARLARRRSRWAMCRRRSPTRADGFEIELLGKRYAARIQPAPLFDANLERMRG